MSRAEYLLNSLLTEIEPEKHITVGQDRVIRVPQELKTIAVTGDKDIESVTFDCARYWDGNDLSTFAIYLNYVLPDMRTGTYIPEKIITSDDDAFYHFDWKIKNNITQKNGKISFAITAIKTREEQNGATFVDKQWSSLPNTECRIASGLDIYNVPDDEESSDILAQMSAILQQMRIDVTSAVVQETGTSTEKVMSQYAVTKALENNKKEYSSKISRNSKRITNIENGYSDEIFVTGDMSSVAERIVPENALPYAEVKKVYGGNTYINGTFYAKKPMRIESCKRDEKKPLDLTLDLSEMVPEMTVEKLADGSFKFNGYTSTPGNQIYCKFATVTLPAGRYGINYRIISEGTGYPNISANGVSIYSSVGPNYGYFELSESTELTFSAFQEESMGELIDVVVSFEIQRGYIASGYEFVGEFVPISAIDIPVEIRNIQDYGFTVDNVLDLENKKLTIGVRLVDNKPNKLTQPEVIDVSRYLGDDNLIEVVPNGAIRVIQDTGEVMDCKCEVVYMLKGV